MTLLDWQPEQCRYCGNPCNDEFCNSKCRKSFEDYYSYREKWHMKHVLLMVVFVFVVTPGIFIKNFSLTFVGVYLMVLGLINYIFPFGSEKKCRLKGVYKSASARVTLAVVLIGLGASFLILNAAFLYMDWSPF